MYLSKYLLPYSIFLGLISFTRIIFTICDALRDLVLFVQFKICEKHPWMSNLKALQVEISNLTESISTPRVFSTLFKLYKFHQIAQRITYEDIVLFPQL